MKLRSSALAGILLSTVACPAIAAAGASEVATEDPQTIIVTGERPGYSVDSLSSATRTPTDLNDVPQSVSVITERQVEDQAMRSVADVLRFVPGAYSGQGEGHRDQIVLRGNNSTADFFIDGLRDDVQHYRGLYNVERVEVLKGPNAMIFGRGGGGGVINRVLKKPLANRFAKGSASIDQEGAWLIDADVIHSFSPSAAVRINAVHEEFASFRDEFDGSRAAVNPTAAFSLGGVTRIDLSYEFSRDDRIVDRGVPSLGGRPLDGFDETFFGATAVNDANFEGHVARATLQHRFSDRLSLTSRLLYGDYDKLYRNLFPATPVTVEAGVAGFGVEAYQDGTDRRNLISQTDLLLDFRHGAVSHRILAGVELAGQDTANFRFNGLFANPSGGANVTRRRTDLSDPFAPPPVAEWRLARDSETEVSIFALYAQDQVGIGRHIDLIAGLRFDRFRIDATNLIGSERFGRTDELWSPRLALVAKPSEVMSIYGSYSRSYLPQSGDQFTSLALSDSALKPERFNNVELGFKWDLLPTLAFTAALYQLDRANSRAPGATPGTLVLTGEQRSRGLELELAGAIRPHWHVSAGYALQDGEITETTASAPKGRELPLFPKHQLSFWTRYDVTPRIGIGAGLTYRSKMFASLSNAVVLPASTRVDLAGYYRLSDRLQAQVNVENIFDEDDFVTAHNDNNIMPGAPRTARLTLRFGL